MGILNVTPDSFSDGGQNLDPDVAVQRGLQMVREGVDIIDIGGESSRPGADEISLDEELDRVRPVVASLAGKVSVPLSIDTRRADVARSAIESGARIINDISSCSDPKMPGVVEEFGVPIVIMHMKGTPKSMQVKPTYDDVVGEVEEYLEERVNFLKHRNIEGDRIVIDPGIGFGKRFHDNLELLSAMGRFTGSGQLVLVGASRKAFIGELVDAGPDARLAGSLAAAAWCYRAGVDIIRVHDVKETVDLFRVLDAIEHPGDYRADW